MAWAGFDVSMLYIEGSTRPATAMISMVEERPAESLLKRCSLYFSPPKTIARPISSSTFSTIEPMMEALTISTRPLRREKMAIKNSMRLPKVALIRAETVLETRWATIPVDSTMTWEMAMMEAPAGDEGQYWINMEIIKSYGKRNEYQEGIQDVETRGLFSCWHMILL